MSPSSSQDLVPQLLLYISRLKSLLLHQYTRLGDVQRSKITFSTSPAWGIVSLPVGVSPQKEPMGGDFFLLHAQPPLFSQLFPDPYDQPERIQDTHEPYHSQGGTYVVIRTSQGRLAREAATRSRPSDGVPWSKTGKASSSGFRRPSASHPMRSGPMAGWSRTDLPLPERATSLPSEGAVPAVERSVTQR